MTADDFTAIWISIKLASVVTILLLLIGTPIAYWLACTKSRIRPFVQALVALPLVLPPSVIGFYLLLGLGAQSPIGLALNAWGFAPIVFSFGGLVIASIFYAMPFVVQPIASAIEAVDMRQIEAAKTLGANTWDIFWSIIFPLSRLGFLSAGVLGFAHTIGEFGIVLMIGGNIPGVTKVASVAIFDHVESLNYASAHMLSLIMLAFSFLVLWILYLVQPKNKSRIL